MTIYRKIESNAMERLSFCRRVRFALYSNGMRGEACKTIAQAIKSTPDIPVSRRCIITLGGVRYLMPAGVSEAVVLVPEGDLPERPKRLRSRSLEPEQIRQIRRLHDLGCKQIEIARKFGVHSATIRQITLGETYKDVV